MKKLVILLFSFWLLSSCGEKKEIEVGERYLYNQFWNDDDPFQKAYDTVQVLDIKDGYVKFRGKYDFKEYDYQSQELGYFKKNIRPLEKKPTEETIQDSTEIFFTEKANIEFDIIPDTNTTYTSDSLIYHREENRLLDIEYQSLGDMIVNLMMKNDTIGVEAKKPFDWKAKISIETNLGQRVEYIKQIHFKPSS